MAKFQEKEVSTMNSFNKINTGTVIKGDVKSNGDIRIDGTLIGTIDCKGKVIVGATGNIEGEIRCQNADIEGVVKAQVHVSELLMLKPTANIKGDITINKLAIEPGAKFSGVCKMEGSMGTASPASNETFKKEAVK